MALQFPVDKDTQRRLKILEVSPNALLHLLKYPHDLVAHAIPSEARLEDAGYSLERGVFMLKLQCNDFELVGDGDAIPKIESPVMRTRCRNEDSKAASGVD